MTGLIGWWPLHENTGSTARDLSGKGSHGILSGGVTQGVAGKGGLTAYSFDGNDDGINLGNDAVDLSGADQFTVSAWVKWDGGNSGSQKDIFHQGNYDVILINNDSDKWQIYYQDSSGGFPSAETDSTENSWELVTGVYNGSELELYVNGQLRETTSNSSPVESDSGTDAIGESGDGDRYFSGSISDLRVYNRALSPEEIQTLYEWGAGDYTDRTYHDGSDSGAVSRWKFEGDVNDSWGSNDGGSSTSSGFTSDSISQKAMQFDGSEYIQAPNNSSLDINSKITVSTWIKSNDTATGRCILAKAVENGERNYQLYQSSNGEVHWYDTQNGAIKRGTIHENVWEHTVATFKDGKLTLYKNGKILDTITGLSNLATNNGPLWIGDDGHANRWNGKLDDIRIYNRAFSPSEVFQLYQWGTRGRDMRKLTVNSRGDT